MLDAIEKLRRKGVELAPSLAEAIFGNRRESSMGNKKSKAPLEESFSDEGLRHVGPKGSLRSWHTKEIDGSYVPLYVGLRETHRFPNRYKLVLVSDRSLRAEFYFERKHGEWGYLIHVNALTRLKEFVVPVEYNYFNGIKNIKILKLLLAPMQYVENPEALFFYDDETGRIIHRSTDTAVKVDFSHSKERNELELIICASGGLHGNKGMGSSLQIRGGVIGGGSGSASADDDILSPTTDKQFRFTFVSFSDEDGSEIQEQLVPEVEVREEWIPVYQYQGLKGNKENIKHTFELTTGVNTHSRRVKPDTGSQLMSAKSPTLQRVVSFSRSGSYRERSVADSNRGSIILEDKEAKQMELPWKASQSFQIMQKVLQRVFPAFGGHELVEVTGTMEWKIENLKEEGEKKKKVEKKKKEKGEKKDKKKEKKEKEKEKEKKKGSKKKKKEEKRKRSVSE